MFYEVGHSRVGQMVSHLAVTLVPNARQNSWISFCSLSLSPWPNWKEPTSERISNLRGSGRVGTFKFAKWMCANDPSVPKNFVQRLQGYFKFWQTIFEGPCIQILPIVCTYFTCNSKNKENSHCVRNGSIGDLCYCQAINEKIVRMFKNIDE